MSCFRKKLSQVVNQPQDQSAKKKTAQASRRYCNKERSSTAEGPAPKADVMWSCARSLAREIARLILTQIKSVIKGDSTCTRNSTRFCEESSAAVVPHRPSIPSNPDELRQPLAEGRCDVVQSQESAPCTCSAQPDSLQESSIILGRKITEVIGSGAFGKVYVAHNVTTGKKEVMKMVEVTAEALREAVISAKIAKHPNVIQQFTYTKSETHIHMFMQYGGPRNLHHLLQEEVNEKFEVDRALHLFKDVLNAVTHIHNHGVCHLDIKPENIMVGEDNILRLTDFGSAAPMTPVKNPYGSLPFAAPEVLDTFQNNTTYWGDEADIFSMGVLLFELCFGLYSMNAQLGWNDQTQEQLLADPDKRAAEMREVLPRMTFICETRLSIVGASAGQRQIVLFTLLSTLCPSASMRRSLSHLSSIFVVDNDA